MKNKNIIAAALSLALLTACNSGQAPQTSETVSDTETSAAATSAATTAKTETAASAITTAAAETETVPETKSAEAAEETGIKYAEVSEGNEFIDYNLIPNYPGTTDIGSLEDKALEFLKATEFYADSMKNADKFKWESFMRGAIGDAEFKERMRLLDEKEAAKFAVYLDGNGNVQPKLSAAYPADYDGDGKEEAFIILNMPMMINNRQIIESYVIFSNSDGKMTMLDNYPAWVLCPARLIDYGKVKHIVIGGDGSAGAESVNTLYGVQNGECISLYCERVGYYKENCFLATYGWQGGGDFMYYDTVKQKYCNIYSDSVPLEKIKEMDKDNVFEEYYKRYEEDGYIFFDLIGGKYYCVSCGPMDTGVIYTYENGKFVRQEHCYARASRYGTRVDIDKALAEMKPVSDPISPVSKGSEFIDFEFTENYQGTADIGGLADKAVNYIKDGYFCETANKYANEFSDEKFAAYFDSDGNIVPKFLTAYPNDYDGDGKTETFIIVEMPYYMGRSEIAVINDYLIFADSDGNVEMQNRFYNFDPQKDAVLLNYGKYKHILFHADGYESDKITVLCGAHTWNSRAVTYYDSDNYGGGGVIKKDGCYLSVSDSYASDYFMLFDTVTQEYVTLLGKNYGSSMPAPLGTNQNAEIKPVQE